MTLALRIPLIKLGLALGVFAAGPAQAYEYGWIVGRQGPRQGIGITASASRSAGIGVWGGIASAPALRTGAGGGPWRHLVNQSTRLKSASPQALSGGAATPPARREASPPSPGAGGAAKDSTPPRR